MIFEERPQGLGEFPREHDVNRIRTIHRDRLLWQANHEQVFTKVSAGLDIEETERLRRLWAALDYVPVNLLGHLSRDTSEHLALEPSDITSEDVQDDVDAIREESGWDAMLLDVVETCSALGEVGLKVFGEGATIDMVQPDVIFRGEDYFAEYAALNRDPRRTVAPFIVTPHRVRDAWYVLLEIHEPGAVLYRAFEWEVPLGQAGSLAEKGVIGRQVELSTIGIDDVADYETGIEAATLVLVQNEPNQLTPGRGLSDYTTDAVALQSQFNEKLSVLLRHFRELVNGGVLQLPIEMQSMVLRRSNKDPRRARDFGRNADSGRDTPVISPDELEAVFTDSSNSASVKFHARSPQYEGGLRSLQLVVSAFERVTGCTLDSLIEQSAAPESGRAMRLSRIRDLKRIMRKHQRYARVFASVFELALEFSGVQDAQVSYEFPDPFPMDEAERAEIAQIRVGGPTLSLETALERYFEHSAEEAKAEVALIKSAQQEAGVQTGLGLFGRAARPEQFRDEDENLRNEEE
jgi:hypothetical protein